MDVSLFDYHLPAELIAQEPAARRDRSRMMVVDRAQESIHDTHFSELPSLIRPGDCLVVNDTKVIPARLIGKRMPTGGKAELFLIHEVGDWKWECLAKPGKKLRRGSKVSFGDGRLVATIVGRGEGGLRTVQFSGKGRLDDLIDELGATPLPPYIKRPEPRNDDRSRYQTVYAEQAGAVAAPTAGLHFTPAILQALRDSGVAIATVTLHVGWGTFQPIDVERVEDHVMHREHYDVPVETAEAVNAAKSAGGRLIAVGTTSVRTIETAAIDGQLGPGSGWTDCFIYPGYEFKAVDAMLTNFHLPKSSLLMLVSALAGRDRVLAAYEHAVAEQYRFYSYGDCMLIV